MVKNKGFLPSGPSEVSVQRKQIKAIIQSLLPACTVADPEAGSGLPFRAQAIIANPPAYGAFTNFRCMYRKTVVISSFGQPHIVFRFALVRK